MTQYIDKDKVIKEIDRLQDIIRTTAIDDRISKEQAEAYKVCVKLRSFIEDTTEAKSVDLKKEIELIKGDYEQVDVAWNNDFDFIAKHFFELGLKTKID